MGRVIKKNRYFFLFICFTCLIIIGEGCKNGNLTTASSDALASESPPVGVSGTDPDGTNPDGTNPDGTNPDGTNPDGTNPDGTNPDGTNPDPDGTNPDGTNPEDDILKDSFQVVQSLADPQVDILVVIDTSGSMNHHQKKLGKRFGDLVASLSSNTDLTVDWQMAFINADNSAPRIDDDGYHGIFYNLENEDGELLIDGEKVNILTPGLSDQLDESDNLQEIFLNTIDRTGKSTRKMDGKDEDSGTEAPLENIKNAIIMRNDKNSGFFRDSATLVTIILSNEDEYSEGKPIDGFEPTTAADVIQSITDAFGSNKKFISYGIIIIPGDTECRDAEIERSGRITPTYSTFIQELSAKTYSICEEDYSATLLDIGNHLEATLTLSSIAFRFNNVIEDTIKLTFTPEENAKTGSFDASSNTYIFDEAPANGTKILVEYEYRQ